MSFGHVQDWTDYSPFAFHERKRLSICCLGSSKSFHSLVRAGLEIATLCTAADQNNHSSMAPLLQCIGTLQRHFHSFFIHTWLFSLVLLIFFFVINIHTKIFNLGKRKTRHLRHETQSTFLLFNYFSNIIYHQGFKLSLNNHYSSTSEYVYF